MGSWGSIPGGTSSNEPGGSSSTLRRGGLCGGTGPSANVVSSRSGMGHVFSLGASWADRGGRGGSSVDLGSGRGSVPA
jgi:hypothetical protein